MTSRSPFALPPAGTKFRRIRKGETWQTYESSPRLPLGTYADGRLVLEIPAIPPSPNRYNGRHWSVYRKSRKAWAWWIAAAVSNACCGTLLWSRSRVSITRMSRRSLDPDNAVASTKCVIDGLRGAKVIENDTADHITLEVRQEISRIPRTVIEVTKL